MMMITRKANIRKQMQDVSLHINLKYLYAKIHQDQIFGIMWGMWKDIFGQNFLNIQYISNDSTSCIIFYSKTPEL